MDEHSSPETDEKPKDVSEGEKPLKLFVGQVPKDWDEEKLRPLFDGVGDVEVVEIVILRDHSAGTSKGCAFVTVMGREQADKCIESLNDKITLPGAAHGVQVRYAEGELDRLEPKLFVGMVPKNASESDLRSLFSQYGIVVEVVLLRSPDGRSRGAAFVRYDSLEAAEAAIHALHDKHSMPGGVHPLVVRRADTSYEKRKKRRMQFRHGYRPAPMYPPPMSAYPPMFVPQLTPQFPPGGFDPALAFSASVYISNIPERWTDEDLFGLFAKFGNVIQASVVVDVNTRLSRCFGFVTFDNARAAEESIRSLHGLHVEGRVLKVEPKKGRLY